MRCIGLIAILVLLAAACSERGATQGSPKGSTPVKVETTAPVRRDVVRKLNIAASLDPWEETTLYAKVSGYVRQLRVDRGSHVKKGDLIAILDVPEAQTEIARVAAEEKQARAVVEQAQAEIRLQEITAKRLTAIRAEESGAVSQQDIDVANGKLEAARSALATAESRFGVLRANADRERTLAAYSRITAPFDGVVTDRYVDVGALLAAGTSGKSSPIAKIVNAKKLRVMVDVPESDVPFVAVGNAAMVTCDAVGGQVFEGKVSRRADALEAASRTMRVEVELDNADGRLTPRMFGRVKLDLETRKNVLTIDPKNMKLQKDQAYVFVVKDGTAKRVNIKCGADDGKIVEVIEGLSGDEAVITSLTSAIADGAPVTVTGAPATAGR